MAMDVGQVHGESVEANIENPRGFFESQAITEMNDAILEELSSRWDCPPPLPTNGWSVDERFKRRAGEIRHSLRSTSTGELIIKDPRITVLLPIWRRALLDRTTVVFIHRDPVEVAWSLYLRNGFDPMLGFALWATYNTAALRDLDGLSVHVCSYEQLASDPSATFEQLAASLSAWGESVDVDKVQVAAESIDLSLGRATWPQAQRHEFVAPEEIADLHRLLISKEGSHQTFEESFIEVPRWAPALLQERRSTISLERQIEAARRAQRAMTRSHRVASLLRGHLSF